MSTPQDIITGTIRTAVPGAIGFGIAKLVAAVPAVQNIIDYVNDTLADAGYAGLTVEFLLTIAAVGAAIAGYYRAARWAGGKWPWLEKWLVGSAAVPAYGPGDTSASEIAYADIKAEVLANHSLLEPDEQFADIQAARARQGLGPI